MGIYIQYIKQKIVVLASEPVGGRSRATELPCLKLDIIIIKKIYFVEIILNLLNVITYIYYFGE